MKAWGEWSSTDFPAEHAGARRLRRWAPVLLAIIAAITPRVVAVTPTVPLLLVEDVAGVTVVSMATRVPDALLYMSQLDTVVHRGCLRPGRRAYRGCLVPSRWWGVHRGLVVLLCNSASFCRGRRGHTRRRALGLLHYSSFKKSLRFLAQITALGHRWFGHGSEKNSRSGDLLTGSVQGRLVLNAAIRHDPVPNDASSLSGSRIVAGTLLLECGTQLLCMLPLLLELGFKLLELRQLRLL